jgi:hypothetical protein
VPFYRLRLFLSSPLMYARMSLFKRLLMLSAQSLYQHSLSPFFELSTILTPLATTTKVQQLLPPTNRSSALQLTLPSFFYCVLLQCPCNRLKQSYARELGGGMVPGTDLLGFIGEVRS